MGVGFYCAGPYWPYGAQPMMQPMYNEMMTARTEESSSPSRHANSSDSHNWRPHRISRNSGDRSYDPSQVCAEFCPRLVPVFERELSTEFLCSLSSASTKRVGTNPKLALLS